ncbi:MAG: hypothetical protein IRY95_06650 [Clostridia bacterium]|nr:hypothetical protein [Clostridia bacterium]
MPTRVFLVGSGVLAAFVTVLAILRLVLPTQTVVEPYPLERLVRESEAIALARVVDVSTFGGGGDLPVPVAHLQVETWLYRGRGWPDVLDVARPLDLVQYRPGERVLVFLRVVPLGPTRTPAIVNVGYPQGKFTFVDDTRLSNGREVITLQDVREALARRGVPAQAS